MNGDRIKEIGPVKDGGEKTADEQHKATASPDHKRTENQENKKTFKKKLCEHFGEPTGFLEGIGVAILIIGVLVNLALWRAQMRANGINEHSFIAGQRPYISFKTVEPASPSEVALMGHNSADLLIPIEVENSGNTWPTNLHIRVWCGGPNMTKPDRNFSNIKPIVYDSFFVAPKDTVTAAGCGIGQANIRAHASSFIGVEGTYTDGLSGTDKFITEFCVKVEDLRGSDSSNYGLITDLCDTHNCADAGCKPEDIPHS